MKTRLVLTLFMGISLGACGPIGQAATPLPTVVLESPSNSSSLDLAGVTASGFVVPAAEAQLAFGLAGLVDQVYVSPGDRVRHGELLAELDSATYRLEFDQAVRTLRELTSPAAVAAA